MANPATRLAVGAILCTGFLLSFGDALVRGVLTETTIWALFVLRSGLAVPVLLALLIGRKTHLKPGKPGLVFLRSGLLLAMWLAYYSALPFLPLATAAAAYYTIPIIIALLAAATTPGEALGRQGWCGVALGFAGVLLIVRPDPVSLNLAALLPLLAAVLYACAMVLTRNRIREEDPLLLTLWLNVLFIALGAAGLALTPEPLPWAQLPIIALIALVMVLGTILSAFAYQKGPSAVIGTFDYGYLAFAVLWGWAFFGELPDVFAWLGILCILAAGVLVIWRRGSETGVA